MHMRDHVTRIHAKRKARTCAGMPFEDIVEKEIDELHTAVNAERRDRDGIACSMTDVIRIERSCAGHVDYAAKLGLRLQDLVEETRQRRGIDLVSDYYMVPMVPMPEGVECLWCGSDHTERPDGKPFQNREGETFCCKNHRDASTRALHRLLRRFGQSPSAFQVASTRRGVR